ncbi:MAG: RidA family protein [Thermodesulfobacteriota bacterium]
MPKTLLQPDGYIPRGPFSAGIQVGNLVFVSGQISRDRDGKLVGPGDIKTQTRVVIERIGAILAEAGMTLEDVVSTTVYLQDLKDYKDMNEVYAALFKRDFPARATIRADLAGEGLLVEIAAIAARG